MKYSPLKSYPQYEDNPFLTDFIKTSSINKFVVVKGNSFVISQTIYNNGIEYELAKSAKKTLIYLLTKCFNNGYKLYIDFDEALEFTDYKGKNLIRSSLAILVEHNIIARSTNPYKFFLNPIVLKEHSTPKAKDESSSITKPKSYKYIDRVYPRVKRIVEEGGTINYALKLLKVDKKKFYENLNDTQKNELGVFKNRAGVIRRGQYKTSKQ